MNSKALLLALVTLTILEFGAANAVAGVQENGVNLNGVNLNGVNLNGVNLNGVNLNGVNLNGVNLNGVYMDGSLVRFSMVPPTSGLPHHEQATGSKMPWGGSSCVSTVCGSDSWCCNNDWDSICVKEANTWCSRSTYSSYSFDNAILTGTKTDGTTMELKVTNVQGASPQPTPYMVYDCSGYCGWKNKGYTYAHTIKFRNTCAHSPKSSGSKLVDGCNACVSEVCAIDSWCCNNSWDSICVSEANSWCGSSANSTWQSVCGYDDTNDDGYPDAVQRDSILVPGRWDYQQNHPNGGDKLSTSNTEITVACEGAGAIGKCVGMGYQPWTNWTMDNTHQACTRMVRGDYCSTGTPMTTNGREINVYDRYGRQTDAMPWTVEAVWDVSGARCISETRVAELHDSYVDGCIDKFLEFSPTCSASFASDPGGYIINEHP